MAAFEGSGVGNVNVAVLETQVAVPVPVDWAANATVTTPVAALTEVMGAFVRLYEVGMKPVVVKDAPTKTPEGNGVGKVNDATPPDQMTVVAVPKD